MTAVKKTYSNARRQQLIAHVNRETKNVTAWGIQSSLANRNQDPRPALDTFFTRLEREVLEGLGMKAQVRNHYDEVYRTMEARREYEYGKWEAPDVKDQARQYMSLIVDIKAQALKCSSDDEHDSIIDQLAGIMKEIA